MWEEKNDRKLVVWYVTASAEVATVMAQYFPSQEPRPDGSYTPQGNVEGTYIYICSHGGTQVQHWLRL
jgi:hypothetical protein